MIRIEGLGKATDNGKYWGERIWMNIIRLAEKAAKEQKTNLSDILVRSFFFNETPEIADHIPYITFSGERYPVPLRSYPPICEILTLYHSSPTSLYFPYFLDARYDPDNVRRYTQNKKENRKKCCAIVSNMSAVERVSLLKTAQDSKIVDLYGRGLGRPVEGGWETLPEFYRNYQFALTFENSNVHGYITEKIMNAFIAGAIPIYWGCPSVKKIFNPEAFFYVSSSEELADVLEKIRTMGKKKILEMSRRPVFTQYGESFNDILRGKIVREDTRKAVEMILSVPNHDCANK